MTGGDAGGADRRGGEAEVDQWKLERSVESTQ
jgi:hypothetical protein